MGLCPAFSSAGAGLVGTALGRVGLGPAASMKSTLEP